MEKNMKLVTFQGLDISTGHISAKTNSLLGQVAGTNDWRFTVAEYEYGYFIVVPNFAKDDQEYEYFEDVPEDLKNLLNFARDRNCLVLRLDADGEIYEELPYFEWELLNLP